MAEPLVVHLSRDGPHSVDLEAPVYEADGSFDIVLENHGRSLHVHLHLDDDLSAGASIATINHYVDEDAVRRVHVTVDDHRLPLSGRLKIVTGYGTETAYVPIELDEPDEDDGRVRVDERLGRPPPREPESGIDTSRLPVVGLGIVALVAAIAVATTVGGPVAIAGIVIVAVGIAVAGVLLRNSQA